MTELRGGRRDSSSGETKEEEEEEKKRRKKQKVEDTHTETHTAETRCCSADATKHTSSSGDLRMSPSGAGFTSDSREALAEAGFGAGLGSPPSCE